MLEFMKWYHGLIFITFILMVFSPVWFFRKLDKALNGEELKENILDFEINTRPHLVVKDNYNLDRDMHVMQNLDAMIARAPESTKNIWKIKKAEFERSLRWKNLVNFNSGHAHEKVGSPA